MTLNITVTTARFIYQSADFRLLDISTQKTADFETQKISTAQRPGWSASICFARSGPRNSDSPISVGPISVVSARVGDGIARLQGEKDGKAATKESRSGVQGEGGAAIRGDKTLSELAEQFDVHPHQITEKKQLLERAGEVFGGASRKDEPQVDVKAMQAKIGQLALERTC